MAVYDDLRKDILTGSYEPGSKLKIELLKQRYGAGVNLIRESLARLTSEGLVSAQDQKGFRVADISSQRFGDLTRMRIMLEIDGATHSIKRGDLDWETNLVAAHHKLVHVEEKMSADETSNIYTWHQYDWEFHAALISACGSELHRKYHRQVFDQFRQYLLLELKTHGFRGNNIIDEHEAILTAALNRDVDACANALEKHLNVYWLRSETH